MRYENRFNAKLAINRMVFNLPRNALSKYTSRPVRDAEEEAQGEEEDDPDDWRGREKQPDPQDDEKRRTDTGVLDRIEGLIRSSQLLNAYKGHGTN